MQFFLYLDKRYIIMKTLFMNRNFYVVFGADLILFAMAHMGAYLMRFEFHLSGAELTNMLKMLPFIIALKALVFWEFGLYKGMWRYAGINDLMRLLESVVVSSMMLIGLVLLAYRFNGFSRTVFILDGGLTLLFCGGLRLFIRTLYQQGFYGKIRQGISGWRYKRRKKPIIIIGAGDAGEMALREINDNPALNFRVVGFVDNDTMKKGRLIHGVPVLGGLAELSRYLETYAVESVLIAIPSATGAQMRCIVDACEQCKILYKTLPGLGDLIDGKVSVKELRDVDYQDLLGRPSVELDIPEIEGFLKNKKVLVTGAGGSIGSELCRQIVRFNPAMLIMVDASEPNLYSIQMELHHRVNYLKYVTILGSTQDEALMSGVFRHYQPHVVFHAAAYKHVPMLEANPWEAVLNNIKGTNIAIEQSIRNHVDYFVLVSTDKAVRPTNVMGTSKRLCELLLQAHMGNGTRMMGVRFGNVLGSSGSVIPLFREQIARGGPVTVTHPEVMRYFMTIPEASKLILQAGSLGEGGEVFILEMGTPVNIADMARDLIRLSGKDPDFDIKIVYTGLRPGEKLYEELITQGEGIVPTSHEKILVLRPNGDWHGHGSQEKFMEWLMAGVNKLYEKAEKHDSKGIRAGMKELVPEYQPDKGNVSVL